MNMYMDQNPDGGCMVNRAERARGEGCMVNRANRARDGGCRFCGRKKEKKRRTEPRL